MEPKQKHLRIRCPHCDVALRIRQPMPDKVLKCPRCTNPVYSREMSPSISLRQQENSQPSKGNRLSSKATYYLISGFAFMVVVGLGTAFMLINLSNISSETSPAKDSVDQEAKHYTNELLAPSSKTERTNAEPIPSTRDDSKHVKKTIRRISEFDDVKNTKITLEDHIAFQKENMILESLDIDINKFRKLSYSNRLDGFVPDNAYFNSGLHSAVHLGTECFSPNGDLREKCLELLKSLDNKPGSLMLFVPRNKSGSWSENSSVGKFSDGRTNRATSTSRKEMPKSFLSAKLLKQLSGVLGVSYIQVRGKFDGAVFKDCTIPLKGLDVSYTGNPQLEYLQHLPQLKYFRSVGNRSSESSRDLSPLRYCKDLQLLNIDLSPKDDFRPLSDLTNIKSINPHGAGYNDLFLDAIGRQGSLEELRIFSPDYTADSLNSFLTTNSLIVLEIPSNKSTGMCSQSLALQTNLCTLNLSTSDLSDHFLSCIAKMPKLIDLDLRNNRIQGIGLKALSKCDRLIKLDLSKNQIESRYLSFLENLSRLECLVLDHNPVDDQCLKFLHNHNELKLLGLRSTKITNEAVASLAQIPNLSSVYVSDTAITPQGIRDICSALKKGHLGISEDLLNTEQLAALKREFPNVYISLQ